MELRQVKGPFSSGQVITIPAELGYSYVHIGIQVPKTQPITVPVISVSADGKTFAEIPNQYRETSPAANLSINNMTYQLNAAGILEFDGLSEVEWTIRFLRSFPAETIIDIVRS